MRRLRAFDQTRTISCAVSGVVFILIEVPILIKVETVAGFKSQMRFSNRGCCFLI